MSNLMHIDKEYAAWIERISQKFRQSQLKAATHVLSLIHILDELTGNEYDMKGLEELKKLLRGEE